MIRVPNIQLNSKLENNFKIVLLGDSGIGKTSIIEKICSKENIKCLFDCNVEFGEKSIQINEQQLNLQFFNLIESEKFDVLRLKRINNRFFENTSLVIILFDLTRLNYVESLSRWISEVKRYYPIFSKNFKILCVGTKADKKPKDYFLFQSEVLGSQLASCTQTFSQNIYYFEISSQNCSSCSQLLEQIKYCADSIISDNN